MTDVDAVLAANEEFYRAFNDGDADALEAVWATEAAVACIHPGWPILRGRDQVLASWRTILSGPDSPSIQCSEAQVEVLGDTAYVTCVETLAGGSLVATNLFVREHGEWRILHHQAGAVSPAFEEGKGDPSETLH